MSAEIVVTCRCGAPMTERTNNLNGSRFLGCQRFPDCTETRPVPEAILMRRAGAMELPGMKD